MGRIRAYFKLDLYFFEHPKVVDLSHSAMVLYIAAVAYCNRRETDGFVAAPVLRRLIEVDAQDDDVPSHTALASELVGAGLWELVEGGWQVHDFLDHNESSEERDERRSEDAARKRAARAAKGRPDGPEPPSGGPSGPVPPDGDERPSGRGDVSKRTPGRVHDIAVPEQSSTRAQAEARSRPLSLVPSDAKTPDPDPVVAVFDAWVGSFPSETRRDLTDARRTAIALALDRYPVEDVTDAARGWVNDPWPERAQQNDIAQLLHMGSRRKPQNVLEKMRDLARNGRPAVLSKASAQIVTEHQRMDRWVTQMEGGGYGVDDAPGVAAAPRPPGRELPRPGAAG